jgi:hypothetical protein
MQTWAVLAGWRYSFKLGINLQLNSKLIRGRNLVIHDVVRIILRIPEAHEFRSHDGIINITTGEDVRDYYQRDETGKLIARYRVAIEAAMDGSGSITWTKQKIDR